MALLVVGVALVTAGAWVGQRNDVYRRLSLEIRGTRGMATAEPLGADTYRLRLPLESSIYTRMYKGELPGGSAGINAAFSIPVVFEPSNPTHFMPLGLPHIATAVSGLLFVLGMACALTARRMGAAIERTMRLSRLKAEEQSKRKKHRRHHRKHSGHHHHDAVRHP